MLSNMKQVEKKQIIHFLFHFEKCPYDEPNLLFDPFRIEVKTTI